jgi:hypothetical protein
VLSRSALRPPSPSPRGDHRPQRNMRPIGRAFAKNDIGVVDFARPFALAGEVGMDVGRFPARGGNDMGRKRPELHAVPLKQCGRCLDVEPFHFREPKGGFAMSSVLAVIHGREKLRGKLSFGLGRGVDVARNGL